MMGPRRVVQTHVYSDELSQIAHLAAANPNLKMLHKGSHSKLSDNIIMDRCIHYIYPEDLAWQCWYPDAEFVEVRSGMKL